MLATDAGTDDAEASSSEADGPSLAAGAAGVGPLQEGAADLCGCWRSDRRWDPKGQTLVAATAGRLAARVTSPYAAEGTLSAAAGCWFCSRASRCDPEAVVRPRGSEEAGGRAAGWGPGALTPE